MAVGKYKRNSKHNCLLVLNWEESSCKCKALTKKYSLSLMFLLKSSYY